MRSPRKQRRPPPPSARSPTSRSRTETNRPPPAELKDAPLAYVGQLALYQRLLARLLPDKRVEAALLWTEVPALMDVTGAAMEAALDARVPADAVADPGQATRYAVRDGGHRRRPLQSHQPV